MGSGMRHVVVAALIARGGRMLISQRPPNTGHPGCWEFPGGKVEPGEDDHSALRRELTEELGISLEVGGCAWTTISGPLELRFYWCAWAPYLRPRAREVVQFRWIPFPRLVEYEFPPADQGLINDLVEGRLVPGVGGIGGAAVE
jgi:8-oxo-dGTP diphosphatase